MPADPIVSYTAQWDASGKPFWVTASGRRVYVPPATAAQMRDQPRLVQWAASQGAAITRDASGNATGMTSGVPDSSFMRSRGEWNQDTGQYDQGMNMSGVGGLITGSAAVAGPAFIGPALAGEAGIFGGAGAVGASGANGTVAPGVVNLATPASTAAAAPFAPSAAAGAGGAAGTAGGAATSAGIRQTLQEAMKDPMTYAGLASLIPAFMNRGGGSSPFDTAAINEELTKSLAMQRGRMEQAQPVYDTLVNMAYGMSPTRYRGGSAPTGYTPNGAPEGAYRYAAPRFGGK